MVTPLLKGLVLATLLVAGNAAARVMEARIDRVDTAVASLEGVRVRLDWPAGAAEGRLSLIAEQVEAPDLGYAFRRLEWRCPLRRDGQGGWRCDGALTAPGGTPMRLSLSLGTAITDVALSRGESHLAVHRDAASPDATRIDLTRVPVAWAQALVARAWPEARLGKGRLDGRLQVEALAARPLQITGPLQVSGMSLDTPEGDVAAENLGARLALDMLLGERDRVSVDGEIIGGEMLFGTTYVTLQQRSVGLQVEAVSTGAQGWQLPKVHWRDNGILVVDGQVGLDPQAGLRDLDLEFESDDLGRMGQAYLSGLLGIAGLADLRLSGQARAHVLMREGVLHGADVALQGAAIDDPGGRFLFDGLEGDVRYSAEAPVTSELRWGGGALYGLAFGPARLPFASGDGVLRLRDAVTMAMLGGQARFEDVEIRPPSHDQRLDVRFGLALDRLDIGQLSTALDWPAFTGELSGRIPLAHYADDRLEFGGGLDVQVFSGQVRVSELSMERPFGVAPTLTADIAIDDLDLEALTGVFGFGSITGRLDGRIGNLRLVNWQPVAFVAELHTDRHRGVRQRISQRAVQDLSSVGDATFMTSLQGQLIGLFDDFGYARIGIACTLVDEVCEMDGLGSAGRGFTIVQGAGVPRLSVVGFNRRVDWPTLVERLSAIGSGDVAPVIE
jgi:hypothetical protein